MYCRDEIRPAWGGAAPELVGPVDACAFVFDVLHAGAIDEDDARGIRTHDLSLRERRARVSRALRVSGAVPVV